VLINFTERKRRTHGTTHNPTKWKANEPSMTFMKGSPSPQKAPVHHEGELYKYVTVFGWQCRYLVLYDQKIVIKMKQYLGTLGSFELNRHCISADSPEREFCFYVRDTLHNTSISLAAKDMATKEAWMDAVQGVLRILRSKHLIEKEKTGVSPSGPGNNSHAQPRRSVNPLSTKLLGESEDGDGAHPTTVAEGAANFQARNMIYVKVLRALNLSNTEASTSSSSAHAHGGGGGGGIAAAKEYPERAMSVYVKVTMGSSSAKTITMKGTSTDLEWGMMFNYAWDHTMRFGTVEVFETTVSADTLIGTSFVPIFNCFDGDKHCLTLPLYRTSKGQRNTSCGSIQLEVLCTGSPYKGQLVWRFLKQVQVLPELSTSLMAASAIAYSEDSSAGDHIGKRLDDVEEDHVNPYYTRHRHSLHEYQKSGVLDDVKASLNLMRAGESIHANGNGNSDTPMATPSPMTSRTPAKSAMMTALSLTPGSQDNTPAAGESMFIDVDSPKDLSRHPVRDLVDTPATEASLSTGPLNIHTPAIIEMNSELNYQNATFAADERDAANEGVDVDDFLASRGFPFTFPSSEVETVEDFCMRADFESAMERNEFSVRGVLILTNYRLMFVSAARIFSEDENSWNEFRSVDLTTYVPIANITKIEYSSENVALSSGKLGTRERLKIYTTECRTLAFSFTDVDVPYLQLQNRAMHLIRRCCTYTHAGMSKDSHIRGPAGEKFDSCITELGKLWSQIHQVGSSIVDGVGSAEGSVAKRMHRRINMRCINRMSEQNYYVGMHGKILTLVRSAVAIIPQKMTARMWNMTDEQRYELLKAESDILAQLDTGNKFIFDEKKAADGTESGREETQEETLEKAVTLMREEGSLNSLGRRLLIASLECRLALRSMLSSGWDVYKPQEEFARMGIPDSHWRVSKVNQHYGLCSTYPAELVVPASISDEVLKEASSFRSIGRIPNLVWRSTLNGATISRCSQPLVGIRQTRNNGDEALINAISEASYLEDDRYAAVSSNGSHQRDAVTAWGDDLHPPHTPVPAAAQTSTPMVPGTAHRTSVKVRSRRRPFLILDCRPVLNARANQVGGKGFENVQNYADISIQWMDMENIHVVRQSYDFIENQVGQHKGWLTGLNNSGWLKHIRRILMAAVKIVHCVAIEEISVLVHCSDGWDRTPQLTSLGMLMLDPFYRTIRGFIILIEKEWVSFGHKFQDRTGWGPDGFRDEKERSPVFIQWLDCVFQCQKQRPQDFEFNEEMLLFIARHVYSGWFGNFLFNCEKDAMHSHCRLSLSMISIWTCVFGNSEIYRNKGYVANLGLSIPVATKQSMQLWSAYFSRWNDQLWRASWMSDYSRNDLFLNAPGFAGDDEDLHINGGILGVGGNGYDDNDSTLIDSTVVNRQWVDDKLVHHCTRCRANFTFLNRKHHCRCCGNIFCVTCANEQRIISALSSIIRQRVCIECAEKLDAIESRKLLAVESIASPEAMKVELASFPNSVVKPADAGAQSKMKTAFLAATAATMIARNSQKKPNQTPSPTAATGSGSYQHSRISLSGTGGRDDSTDEDDDNDEDEDYRGDSDDWGIDIDVMRHGSSRLPSAVPRTHARANKTGAAAIAEGQAEQTEPADMNLGS